MKVPFDKITIFPRCYDAFALDTDTTWSPYDLTGHMVIISTTGDVRGCCAELEVCSIVIKMGGYLCEI